MCVIQVSTILDHASCIIWGLWNGMDSQFTYQLPLWATMVVTISHLPSTIELPQSIDNICWGSVNYKAMQCIALLVNWVLHGQSFQYVLVYHFTNVHTMFYRSDFFQLLLYSQYLRICILFYHKISFGSLWTCNTQLSNFYHDVWFKIFKYLSATGYDICQKWMCLYLWFEQPYCTNHLRCLVGFHKCRLETICCVE